MKQKASITLYYTLALVMVAVLLLSLIEAARHQGLAADATDLTHMSIESACAAYQPVLWEQNKLLFLDGNFGGQDFSLERGENRMEYLLDENLCLEKTGINFYGMNVRQVQIKRYELATDRDGAAFEAQVVSAEKSRLSKEVAKQLYQQITGMQVQQGGDPEITKKVELAENAIEQAENQVSAQKGAKNEGNPAQSTEIAEETDPIESPLVTFRQMKAQSILSLVVPDIQTVSEKGVVIGDTLLERNCQKGNYKGSSENGWYDRMVYQNYLKEYMGNYLHPQEEKSLSYGMEYIIGRKATDQENLEMVVNRLLVIRETVNYMYLLSDEGKKGEALALATVLGGASANPAVVEAIRQGVLAAWAFAESIADIRTLLAGNKIPIIKTAQNWKMELAHIGEFAVVEDEGGEKGYSYEDYLGLFLYAMPLKNLTYCTMDLLEFDLRLYQNDCRMDHMITRMGIYVEYEASPVFLAIFDSNYDVGNYVFCREANYSYYR